MNITKWDLAIIDPWLWWFGAVTNHFARLFTANPSFWWSKSQENSYFLSPHDLQYQWKNPETINRATKYQNQQQRQRTDTDINIIIWCYTAIHQTIPAMYVEQIKQILLQQVGWVQTNPSRLQPRLVMWMLLKKTHRTSNHGWFPWKNISTSGGLPTSMASPCGPVVSVRNRRFNRVMDYKASLAI